MTEKRCSQCERTKPIADFRVHFYDKKSGKPRYGKCRLCERENYRRKHGQQPKNSPVDGIKLCTVCDERKPVELFRQVGVKRDGSPSYSWCLDCNKAKQREYTRIYRETKREQRHEYWRRRNYGLTPEQQKQLWEQANGRCQICGADPTERDPKLCVDHDHVTGRVRGLLCRNCNTAVGLLNDEPSLVERALHYLQEPPYVHEGADSA
jgi:hypothetical protein